MVIEIQLQHLFAQPWFEAIAVGALFGALGGILFIGLTHLLRSLATERYSKHAAASCLWSDPSAFQDVMRKASPADEVVPVSAGLKDTESLLRLSRNYPAAM